MSNTSFLGHLCAILVGYLRKCCRIPYGYRLLIPRSRPWVSEAVRSAGEDSPLDRGQVESAWTAAPLCVGRPEDVWPLWSPANDQQQSPGRKTDSDELPGVVAASGTLIPLTNI